MDAALCTDAAWSDSVLRLTIDTTSVDIAMSEGKGRVQVVTATP